jgi:nitric oxide synthase-interacting protein
VRDFALLISGSYGQHIAGRVGKRKLDSDSSTIETLTREAEEAALRLIERDQAHALRDKLPDFWLPSLTPTYTSNGPPSSLKDVKVQTMCRGGPPHAIKCVSLS